jgi:hypothetical protein
MTEVSPPESAYPAFGDEEVLTLGGSDHYRHSAASRRIGRWLSVGLAVIVGIAFGRLSLGPLGPTARTVQPSHIETSAAPLNAQGCPSGSTCRTHEVIARQLLGQLRNDFADIRSATVLATDDTRTGHQYQLQLAATLTRGLALEVTAQHSLSQPIEQTNWIYVAVGTSTRPDRAERTITNPHADGVTVHIQLTRTVVQRPGRADFQCDWCRPSHHRTVEIPLSQLVIRPASRMWAMVGIGVETAAHSQALAWLS